MDPALQVPHASDATAKRENGEAGADVIVLSRERHSRMRRATGMDSEPVQVSISSAVTEGDDIHSDVVTTSNNANLVKALTEALSRPEFAAAGVPRCDAVSEKIRELSGLAQFWVRFRCHDVFYEYDAKGRKAQVQLIVGQSQVSGRKKVGGDNVRWLAYLASNHLERLAKSSLPAVCAALAGVLIGLAIGGRAEHRATESAIHSLSERVETLSKQLEFKQTPQQMSLAPENLLQFADPLAAYRMAPPTTTVLGKTPPTTGSVNFGTAANMTFTPPMFGPQEWQMNYTEAYYGLSYEWLPQHSKVTGWSARSDLPIVYSAVVSSGWTLLSSSPVNRAQYRAVGSIVRF